MALRPEFWKGKRVFVTGHTGFKGSWLSLWLQSMGAELTGYALAPEQETNMFSMAHVADGMHSVIGDIRDLEGLCSAMTDARPEIVLHLAAQPLVVRSFIDPVETYSTNVMGTVHVLEVVRNTPSVRAVVAITTDKCYENREWVWGYRETDGLGGYDPYSNSKACAELVCSAYRSSFFSTGDPTSNRVSIATARAGNVIGGGDWAENRIVPDLLAAFAQGQTANVRNPKAVRPWQHVLDPLHGYLLLAERLFEKGAEVSEAWNFGPAANDCRTVGWIADRMASEWGAGASWSTQEVLPFHETNYLKLDCSKAESQLGWHPRWHLEKALEAVVAWHCAFLSGQNMKEMTMGQIQEFNNVEH